MNFSARTPIGGGPPSPYGPPMGNMPDINMPDIPDFLQKTFGWLQDAGKSDIAQGLGEVVKSLLPSGVSHYLSADERAQAQEMYDAQAGLLNQQSQMLRDRHDQEKQPRADLLQALVDRMSRESPSFLPDRPPTRRPYENVRRYDPRMSHQGQGDGYATRLSDALAYKWNPLGGQ